MRFAQIEGGRANQVTDVFDKQQAVIVRFQTLHGMANHVGVQMTPLTGIDLQRRHTGFTDTVGIVGGLLVALNHRNRQFRFQVVDTTGQQRGLAGTGTGDQIQRQDLPFLKQLSVGGGVLVVLAQDILFDLHHARLTHAGCVGVRRTLTVVVMVTMGMLMVAVFLVMIVGMIVIAMAMMVPMGMTVLMVMMMVVVIMSMVVTHLLTLDPGFTFAAAAYGTHQSTSSSLIRSSSPPVICN